MKVLISCLKNFQKLCTKVVPTFFGSMTSYRSVKYFAAPSRASTEILLRELSMLTINQDQLAAFLISQMAPWLGTTGGQYQPQSGRKFVLSKETANQLLY